MKGLKRFLGICLSASLVFSSVAAVSAEETANQINISDNFDDYADTDAVFAETTNWSKYNKSSVEYSGSLDTAEKAFKISWGTSSLVYTFPEALDGGKYIIKAKVKWTDGGKFAISLSDLKENTDDLVYPFRIDKGDDQKTYVRAKTSWTGNNGTLTCFTPINDELIGQYFDVEIRLNLATSTYNLAVKNNGKIVASLENVDAVTYDKAFGDKITSLKQIRFTNQENSDIWIDDFSVTSEKEPEKVDFSKGMKETFDGYASVDEMKENHWSKDECINYDAELLEDSGNKYLKVLKDHGAVYCTGDVIANSGKVRISADVKTSGAGGGIVEFLPQRSSISGNAYTGLYANEFKEKTITLQTGWSDGGAGTKLGSIEKDTWYKMVYILNFDTGRYNVQVLSNDGKVVMLKRNVDMTAENVKGDVLNELYAVRFRNFRDGEFYVDNLEIKSGYEETDKDFLIFEEDFENTTTEKLAKNGWNLNDKVDGYSVKEANGTGNHAFSLTKKDGQLWRSFPAVSEGKIKFSYDYMSNGDWAVADAFTNPNWEYLIMASYSDGWMRCQGEAICAAPANEWQRIEIVFDLGAETLNVTVTNEDNTVYTFKKTNVKTADKETKTWNLLEGFGVRDWADKEIMVDNIKIEYYEPDPALTASSIRFEDAFGETIENGSAGVTPSVKKMYLDFGCDVDVSTVENALTIKDSQNGSPEYTLASQSGGVVVTFAKALKGSETYTVTVANSVLSLAGKKMKDSFTTSFNTTAGKLSVAFGKITNDSAEVTKLSELAKGDEITVNVDFENSTASNAGLSLIIAYYKGNLLSSTESFVLSQNDAGQLGVDPKKVTVGDLDGVTSVKLMLWNGTQTMLPYCNAVTFE